MIDINKIKIGELVKYSPNSDVECEVISINQKTTEVEIEYVNANTGERIKNKYKPSQLYLQQLPGIADRPKDGNVFFILADGTNLDTTIENYAFLAASADYEFQNPNQFLGSDGRPVFTFSRYLGATPVDIDLLNAAKKKSNYELLYKQTYDNK